MHTYLTLEMECHVLQCNVIKEMKVHTLSAMQWSHSFIIVLIVLLNVLSK